MNEHLSDAVTITPFVPRQANGEDATAKTTPKIPLIWHGEDTDEPRRREAPAFPSPRFALASYDIVVNQHGGTLEVSTKPGAFTRFTIILPRTGQAQANRGQS